MWKKKLPLCRQIARKKLSENKMRNLCIIVAVILTTVLFTTVFSSIFYFRNSIQTAELENTGWRAHGAVADVEEKQYEQMKSSSYIADISSYTHLGYVKEEEQNSEIELQYCEDTMASWMYYNLTQGKMPEKEMDMVVSSDFLNSKGLSYTKNMKLKIKYAINGKMKTSEFQISGVYESKATATEVAFISRSFLDKNLQETKEDAISDSSMGKKVVEVMFKNTKHLERDMGKFLLESGAEKKENMLNEVYLSISKPRKDVVFAVICVLLLIMLCGYFIIYNIYYIGVMQDTRFYGSLATLGFREDEIRYIVGGMTNILCIVGIPIGLVIGYLISRLFLPQILIIYGNEVIKNTPSLVIFVFSSIFSYLTVRISSRKPANIAAHISPVEARSYANVNAVKRKKENKIRKCKHSKNSWCLVNMAWKNTMCERKKTLMICCSLSFCIILAALCYSVSNGINMDLFLKDAISCDFILGSKTYFNKVEGKYKGLSSDIIDTIDQWNGKKASGGVSVTRLTVPLDGKAFNRFCSIVGKDGVNQEHTMEPDVYGVDDFIFEKTDIKEGKLDLDKFKTGNYVVAGCFVESQGTSSCYKVGDKVKIEFGNGEQKEYTVLAIGELPYELTTREQYAYTANIYLPMKEWQKEMKTNDYYVYAYDVENDFEAQWDSRMETILKENDELAYESKMTYKKQLEGYMNGILTLGICISIILGVIGVLNFVNSIYNSIYNRKRELAILQSMGMTKNQVYGMLIMEGIYYILISLIISILVGLLLNYLVVTALGSEMDFIEYQRNITPYILLGIFGLVFAVCVPVTIFHELDKKEGVLFRLRLKI